MPTLEQWMDEQTRELEATFKDAKYVLVVFHNDERNLVSNCTPESLQEVFADLADNAGDNAIDSPTGRKN